jgi:hypothetical protein
MSGSTPWLATRVASLVPSVLSATTAQACIPVSDRHGSFWVCSSGSTTCPGGCCLYCWTTSCRGGNYRQWVCGPC